ncbi:hypothetical protein JRO89_XS09G0004000 [Xanthoceras sorbifolium]|uniref:Protein kinase domain-containing protein n=1 Tax=Xanthoceras sorbifolium TaxID=99658 RepID=A0ABQ8HJZ3_9ROSI|nr:hypothetical protein JRO89_XS09G0004000 [Xanthoceras sorbifolium]
MKLLGMLMCMWVYIICLFLSTLVIARPDTTVSTIFSSKMGAQSPGVTDVRIVHHQDLNRKILIALVVASSLLGVLLLFLLCFWIYRLKNWKNSNGKSKQNFDAGKGLALSPIMERFNSLMVAGKKDSVDVIEYHLLESATNNFGESNVLGEGGRGRVYKARFNEKFLAAVKRIEGGGPDAQREFEVILFLDINSSDDTYGLYPSKMLLVLIGFSFFILSFQVQNEMNWLVKFQHQNIISLVGCCIHGDTKFLVYEMMQNGSLENQLHGPTHGSDLTWHLRLKIAVNVARGLEYLHEHCNPPIVHRDLKSSNILLDSSFNAKLSDFGLAVTAGTQNKNVKLSGTLGHVAPEYLLEGKLNDKSDVYAFGVVLLELLIGRRPVEKMSPSQCQSIVTWAMPQLTDRSKLPNIVDPVIRDTMDLKHLYQVAAVAVLCVQPEPSYRPLITDVLHSLIPLVPIELGGSLRVA